MLERTLALDLVIFIITLAIVCAAHYVEYEILKICSSNKEIMKKIKYFYVIVNCTIVGLVCIPTIYDGYIYGIYNIILNVIILSILGIVTIKQTWSVIKYQ